MKTPPNETASETAPSKTDARLARRLGLYTFLKDPILLRVQFALLAQCLTCDEINQIAGVSNGPDLIQQIRARGFEIPFRKVLMRHRLGFLVEIGVYYLTEDDQRLMKSKMKAGAYELALRDATERINAARKKLGSVA